MQTEIEKTLCKRLQAHYPLECPGDDCTLCKAAKLIESQQATIIELTADNANSKREAESLAMSLWRRHYQDVSPDFELCDTTAGVITQIDNMVAGVIQNNENQCAVITSLQAKVEKLTSAIQKWLDGDYPNPRAYRQDCPHGTHYWESCENCETEYWQSVAGPTESDDE